MWPCACSGRWAVARRRLDTGVSWGIRLGLVLICGAVAIVMVWNGRFRQSGNRVEQGSTWLVGWRLMLVLPDLAGDCGRVLHCSYRLEPVVEGSRFVGFRRVFTGLGSG